MRLIDADALKQSICAECEFGRTGWCKVYECDIASIFHIEHAPTIDAVPVIRCKDCKHYYATNEVRGHCSEHNFAEKIVVDFCSWAEGKEE